jgi:hypothetical protein
MVLVFYPNLARLKIKTTICFEGQKIKAYKVMGMV